MSYDPQKHHRQSIRLRGHDYGGPGLYFVTFCVHPEWIAAQGAAPLHRPGVREIMAEEWLKGGAIRPDVVPGKMVVMPDHFHGLLEIKAGGSELGHVIGAFKAAVSRRIRAAAGAAGAAGTTGATGATCMSPVRAICKVPGRADAKNLPRIWQRNYYEVIVRSAEARARIEHYIRMNPWRCVQQFGAGLRGMGNSSLWTLPKLGVLCSRNAPKIGRLPEAEVYLGGWHSPKEVEIFEWLLERGKRVIACPAWGMDGAAKRPSALRALEENRLLILEMRNRDGDLAAAEARNRFVIAEADELFVPHVSAGGMLSRLLDEREE